jgi:hypothetical protein
MEDGKTETDEVKVMPGLADSAKKVSDFSVVSANSMGLSLELPAR